MSHLSKIFQLLDYTTELQIEVKSVLINLFEAFLTNTNAVYSNSDYFFNSITPKLMDLLKQQIYQSNKDIKNIDMKFNYLKLLNDLVISFLNSEVSGTSLINKIHDYFTKSFVKELLAKLLATYESEQVQMMALKLLNLLVDNSPENYVSAIKQNNLIEKIIQQFTTNPSRTTIKLVSKITQCSTLQEISSYKIDQESVKLFMKNITKQQDGTEDIIEIFINITTKLVGKINVDKPSLSDKSTDYIFDHLIQVYELGYSMLNSVSFGISEKFGMFVIHMIHLYGKNNSRRVFKQDYINIIIQNINQHHMVNSMMRRNSRILNWMVSLFDQAQEQKQNILLALDKLMNNNDKKISSNVAEIKSVLSK